MTGTDQKRRCPVCGQGRLVDITYREGSPPPGADEPVQEPDARQVETFSCGHEVTGPRLDRTAAGTEELQVERRSSEETTEPL
jgi:hypothetical protein